jgi:trimeric autotransporter adhesin
MSKVSSIFTPFLVLAGIMILGIWSNIYAYGQQSSSPALPPSTTSSVSKSISPELKAIMCDPSNPDLKVVNTTEAHVCGIAKTVKPGLPQTSPVTSSPNPAPTNLKSTATKAAATTTTTTTTATGVTIPQKPQQIAATNNAASPSTVYVTWATIDSLSNPSNTLPSTIAPQISAVNRQQQLPLFPITRVNSTTAGQNHTFTAISPVASTSDQLVYLGYHGNSKSSHGNGGSNHGDNHDSKGSGTRSTSDGSPTQKDSKPFTPPRIKVVSTDFDSTPKTITTKIDTKNDPKPPKVHSIKTTSDDSSIVKKKKTTIRTNDESSSEDKNSASTESSSHHATDSDSSLKKKRIKSDNDNSKGNDDGSDAISSSKSSSNIENDIPSVIVKSFSPRHSADSDNGKSSSTDDHIPSVIVKSFNSKHSRGDSFFDGDKFFSDEGDDGF